MWKVREGEFSVHGYTIEVEEQVLGRGYILSGIYWLQLVHTINAVGCSVRLWGLCCKRGYGTNCFEKILDCDWSWDAQKNSDMPILWLASLGAQVQVYSGVPLVSITIGRRKRNRIGMREKLGHDEEWTMSQLMPLEKFWSCPWELSPPGARRMSFYAPVLPSGCSIEP